MSSPQEFGSTSPGEEGQAEDAVAAIKNAVFEATQGLLSAQQQLTHTLLTGGQTQADVDEEPSGSGDEQATDPDAAAGADNEANQGQTDQADQLDDETDQLILLAALLHRGQLGQGQLSHRNAHGSSPSRGTLSIRRVEPTRTAAARTGGSKGATST